MWPLASEISFGLRPYQRPTSSSVSPFSDGVGCERADDVVAAGRHSDRHTAGGSRSRFRSSLRKPRRRKQRDRRQHQRRRASGAILCEGQRSDISRDLLMTALPPSAPAAHAARANRSTTIVKIIGQRAMLGNRPQIGELQHQQLDPAAIEIAPRPWRLAAALAPAHHAAAEGLMHHAHAHREVVAVARFAVVGHLAVGVIDVGLARRAARAPSPGRLRARCGEMRVVIDLAQKSRGPRLVALAVQFARQRVGQVEQPPRPRHPDVAQAALLLDFARVVAASACAETALPPCPAMNTTGYSSPLEVCSVISATRPPAAATWSAIADQRHPFEEFGRARRARARRRKRSAAASISATFCRRPHRRASLRDTPRNRCAR